jgi:dipeptidyl aminopeptidase/acylaminoacyl peptidase
MSIKLATPVLLLALSGTTAFAQQTGTLLGRTPGSAANSGIRVVRVIPPPPTCASNSGIPVSAPSNAPVLPGLIFSRMELTCLRHSDGRFEELPKIAGGVLSPSGAELAYWNLQTHELHLRSLTNNSDTILDSLPDLTPKTMFWSAKGRALVYPVNNANPLRYRVLDLDSGKRSIVGRGVTRILGAPDPAHLLAIAANAVERISVSDDKHEVVAVANSPDDAQFSSSGALLGILVPGPGEGRQGGDDDTPDCTGGNFALTVQKGGTKQLLEIPFPEGFDNVLDFSFSPADDAVAITFGKVGCDYPGDVARVYVVSLSNLALAPLSPADRLSVQAHWSPDGKTIVYSDYTGSDTPLIAVDLRSGKASKLTNPGQNGPDTFLSWRQP